MFWLPVSGEVPSGSVEYLTTIMTKCEQEEFNNGAYVFGDGASGLTEINHFTEQYFIVY